MNTLLDLLWHHLGFATLALGWGLLVGVLAGVLTFLLADKVHEVFSWIIGFAVGAFVWFTIVSGFAHAPDSAQTLFWLSSFLVDALIVLSIREWWRMSGGPRD